MKKHGTFSFSVKKTKSSGIFDGYASIFSIVDAQDDIIAKNAFNLTNHTVPILWQHNTEEPIGKTIYLEQNNKGLYIKATLITDIKKGYEAYKLLENNIINGLSIGYIPKKYTINRTNGYRIITSLDLLEISLVTFPANRMTTVSAVKNNSYDANKTKNIISNIINLIK